MENTTAYCFRCNSRQKMKDPIRVKWRNRKSKTGTIEAWKGKCDSCDKSLYRIIGPG